MSNYLLESHESQDQLASAEAFWTLRHSAARSCGMHLCRVPSAVAISAVVFHDPVNQDRERVQQCA